GCPCHQGAGSVWPELRGQGRVPRTARRRRPARSWGTIRARRRQTLDERQCAREAEPLRRLLVSVGQDVVVTQEDCGTPEGVALRTFAPGTGLAGRISRHTVADPVRQDVIVHENEVIGPHAAGRIAGLGLGSLEVRSPLTCQAPRGVCRLCYGSDPV